jgi:hypothetical protein
MVARFGAVRGLRAAGPGRCTLSDGAEAFACMRAMSAEKTLRGRREL